MNSNQSNSKIPATGGASAANLDRADAVKLFDEFEKKYEEFLRDAASDGRFASGNSSQNYEKIKALQHDFVEQNKQFYNLRFHFSIQDVAGAIKDIESRVLNESKKTTSGLNQARVEPSKAATIGCARRFGLDSQAMGSAKAATSLIADKGPEISVLEFAKEGVKDMKELLQTDYVQAQIKRFGQFANENKNAGKKTKEGWEEEFIEFLGPKFYHEKEDMRRNAGKGVRQFD